MCELSVVDTPSAQNSAISNDAKNCTKKKIESSTSTLVEVSKKTANQET